MEPATGCRKKVPVPNFGQVPQFGACPPPDGACPPRSIYCAALVATQGVLAESFVTVPSIRLPSTRPV